MITITTQARPVAMPATYAARPAPAEAPPPRPVVRAGYLVVTCRCGFDGCPGWAEVHDDPDARAYFDKLFGQAGGAG